MVGRCAPAISSGASSYSPLPLAKPPVWVEAGDRMPEGCDCVLDADSVDQTGPIVQVMAEAIPGQGVRRAGGDIAEGSRRRRRAARSPARSLDRACGGTGRLTCAGRALRIVNIPGVGPYVTAQLISENARAAGAMSCLHRGRGARCGVDCQSSSMPATCDLLVTIGGSGVGRTDATVVALASAARWSRMASRCSPAAPPRSAGSENRRSWRCPARRTGRSRRGGRWCFRCWIGCPADGRESRHPAAGAQDRLQRRHRRNRPAGTKMRTPGCRLR